MADSRTIWRRRALPALLLLWAGILIGVDFVAVPAQFAAPGLEEARRVAVTREVFALSNQVQMLLIAASALLGFLARPSRLVWIGLVLIWVIVAVQSFRIFPLLDARVDLLLAGETLPPAPWHYVYLGLEVFKLALLVGLAALVLTRRSSYHLIR